MSRVNFKSGRSNQKLRTRRALLLAARELINEGTEPSLDEVAERAMVSRATAYRYFASAEKLLLEAGLDATWDATVLDYSQLAPDDVATRVAQVQNFLYDNARDNEAQYRLFLSSLHKEWLESRGKSDLRAGRRIPMIEVALGSLRDTLDDKTYYQLCNALAAMMGIDSLVMLRDICKLEHDEAKAVMEWAVRQLVASVSPIEEAVRM